MNHLPDRAADAAGEAEGFEPEPDEGDGEEANGDDGVDFPLPGRGDAAEDFGNHGDAAEHDGDDATDEPVDAEAFRGSDEFDRIKALSQNFEVFGCKQ